jgi:hypothetical protein
MAGNTGKMTRGAIERRGPRMCLGYMVGDEGYFIFREGQLPLKNNYYRLRVLARSYSKSYLMRVGRAQSILP